MTVLLSFGFYLFPSGKKTKNIVIRLLGDIEFDKNYPLNNIGISFFP